MPGVQAPSGHPRRILAIGGRPHLRGVPVVDQPAHGPVRRRGSTSRRRRSSPRPGPPRNGDGSPSRRGPGNGWLPRPPSSRARRTATCRYCALRSCRGGEPSARGRGPCRRRRLGGRHDRRGLAPATVRQAHRVLALVLTLAVRDGRIPRNPATDVPLPGARRAEPRFLTRGQVEQLAEVAGEYGDVVRLLAYTGLRFGEMAALRVRRIDFLRKRLTVAESATEVGGVVQFGSPKTHHQRAPFPMCSSSRCGDAVPASAPTTSCSRRRRVAFSGRQLPTPGL
jgi:hypothetical protein